MLVAEKSATTFGDLPDCYSNRKYQDYVYIRVLKYYAENKVELETWK